MVLVFAFRDYKVRAILTVWQISLSQLPSCLFKKQAVDVSLVSHLVSVSVIFLTGAVSACA